MKNWPTKSLGDLLKIQNGFAFESERFNEAKQGLPIIRIRDLARGYSETFYDGEHETAYEVNDGDFLIGMDGEFRCYRWHGGKALLNQRVCRLQSFDHTLNSSYVFYGINRHLSEIEANTSFVTVKHLSSKQITQIKMPVPPLAEQERLVKLLDEADELRKLRAQADRRTADLIPALFHEMFGDPDSNPKGWPLVPIGEIAPLKSGYAFKSTDYRSKGARLVRISNLDGRNLVFEDGTAYLPDSFLNDCPGFQLAPDDVLIAMSGATTGKLGMVRPVDVPCLLNQRVGKFFIRDQNCLEPTFLFSTLKFPAMTRKLIGEAAGSAQANVSPTNVGNVKIPIPPLPLQKKFGQRVTEMRELEAHQVTNRTRLDALFQSMLHRAFNGQL